MKVFCDVLVSGKYIPAKCAGKTSSGGQNVSLPISWAEIPSGVQSFSLSMLDQHPAAKGIVHWVVINMSANARRISEAASQTRRLPPGSVELRNGFGTTGYTGPQPGKGSGLHEYLITLYALNVSELQLGPISSFAQFRTEASKNIIDTAHLIAVFG